MTDSRFTAEEFAACRPELPEDGRWSELVAGQIVERQPPGETHGLVVLNLSRAVGEWLQPLAANPPCSPCFELGLILAREPDTVRFPAISFFSGGSAFREAAQDVTESVPLLIIELADSARQLEQIPERVAEYRASGVGTVWVFETRDYQVQCYTADSEPQSISGDAAVLESPDVLPGFRVRLGDLFQLPGWWA